MRALLAAAAAVVMATLAFAHDKYGNQNWISTGHYVSPLDGSHCCGEYDCAVVESIMIHEVPGGMHIAGPIEYPGSMPAGALIVRVDEFVPHREVQTSKDGNYWRCKRPDGSRRCFFGPPPAM